MARSCLCRDVLGNVDQFLWWYTILPLRPCFKFVLTMGYDRTERQNGKNMYPFPREGWWSPIRKSRSFKMMQIQNFVQHLCPRQDGSILSAHQSRPGSSSLFFFDQTHGQYLKQKTSYSDNLCPWQSLPEMPSFRSVTLISSLTRHSSRKTMLNVRGACTPLCLNNLLNILLRISISYSVNMPCTSQNDLLFNSQARNAYHVRGKNEET